MMAPASYVKSDDLASVVDPYCSGLRRAWEVNRAEAPPAKKKTVLRAAVGKIVRPYDLARIVDPVGDSVAGGGTGKINSAKAALLSRNPC